MPESEGQSIDDVKALEEEYRILTLRKNNATKDSEWTEEDRVKWLALGNKIEKLKIEADVRPEFRGKTYDQLMAMAAELRAEQQKDSLNFPLEKGKLLQDLAELIAQLSRTRGFK